jgi:hypothetical protein
LSDFVRDTSEKETLDISETSSPHDDAVAVGSLSEVDDFHRRIPDDDLFMMDLAPVRFDPSGCRGDDGGPCGLEEGLTGSVDIFELYIASRIAVHPWGNQLLVGDHIQHIDCGFKLFGQLTGQVSRSVRMLGAVCS